MFYVSTIVSDNIFIVDTTDNVRDKITLLTAAKLGKLKLIKGIECFENPTVCTVREVSSLELIDDFSLIHTITNGTVIEPKFEIADKVLKKVHLPKEIQGSSIIRIPFGIEKIADFAFDSSCEAVNAVILPSTLKKLCRCSFSGMTNLRTLTLPCGLEEIEDGFFGSLKELESLQLDENCTMFMLKDNGLYSADGSVFYRYFGVEGVTSFSMLDSVTKICDFAFMSNTTLKTLSVSKKLKTVGRSAFSYMNIESIELPEGLSCLSPYMFGKCKNLKRVVLPCSLDKIEEDAFTGCEALKEIRIPPHVTNIRRASLTYDGKRVIGGVLFGCTSLETVYMSKALHITNKNKYKRLGVSLNTKVVTY